jgi:hypothetical protein
MKSRGQVTLMYSLLSRMACLSFPHMHCVFSNSPSLDFVVREIRNGRRAGRGLGWDSQADRTAILRESSRSPSVDLPDLKCLVPRTEGP